MKQYEMMVLVNEILNEQELKDWAINCARNLKKLNVLNVSITFQGKHELSYSIKKQTKANYVQINFSILPKYINKVKNNLKLDSNSLRFLILNKV